MKSYIATQDVDGYVEMFEDIYEPLKNSERSFYQVLARLLEATARCSQFVNKHSEQGIADNLPAVFSWYCSLVVKCELRHSLSDILWKKYPQCCPYCVKSPCMCSRGKGTLLSNAHILEKRSKENADRRPRTLEEWQVMFADIYPRDPQSYDQKSNFAHLIEEYGEVAEAYRLKYFSLNSLENELADVFTWIIGIANLLDSRARDGGLSEAKCYKIQDEVFKAFPGQCLGCKSRTCVCLPKDVQKISEVSVLSSQDIVHEVREVEKRLGLKIDEKIESVFLLPEAKELIVQIKSISHGVALTQDKMEEIIQNQLDDPKYKGWVGKLTASGIPQGVIANFVWEFLKRNIA